MYKTYPSIHVGVGVRIGGLITVLITGLITACSSSTVDFKPFFDNIYTLFQPLCLKIGTHIGCNSFMVLFVPKADSVRHRFVAKLCGRNVYARISPLLRDGATWWKILARTLEQIKSKTMCVPIQAQTTCTDSLTFSLLVLPNVLALQPLLLAGD